MGTWLEGICEDCVKKDRMKIESFSLINPEKHYTTA